MLVNYRQCCALLCYYTVVQKYCHPLLFHCGVWFLEMLTDFYNMWYTE